MADSDRTVARGPTDGADASTVVAPRVRYRRPAIGVGLLMSFVVGFDPLSDAITGTGSYESALIRFVACVVFCMAGGAFVGAVLDQSPEPTSDSVDSSSPADAGR